MYQDSIDVTDEMVAGKGRRLVNLLIDVAVYYIITFMIGLIAGVLYAVFEIDGMLIWINEMENGEWILLGLSIILGYYIIMEALFQRTIGKMVTGTKVVMEDGTKPPLGVIILRTLCRFIPFEVFSFLGDGTRGWHDSMMHTYVVDVNKYGQALYLKNSFSEIGIKESH